MNNDDRKEFKMLMLGAGDIYNKPIANPLLQVYFNALTQFSLEEVSAAMTAHFIDPDQGTFFPKPADLVRQIKGSSKDQKRSIESRAELAWSQIYYHITTHGPYRNLKMDDKQGLAAVKTIGGMNVLSTADNEKMTWLKKEFISQYDTLENTPLEQLPSTMPGLVELQQHKLEQKEGMKSILEIASNMEEKQPEQEPIMLSHEQNQAKAAELVNLVRGAGGKSDLQVERERDLERAAQLKQDFKNKYSKE